MPVGPDGSERDGVSEGPEEFSVELSGALRR